ncbi:MAG: type II toxin-antitoxin system RelE/ParE family toxin [Frankiaceae bacterium]
MTDSTYSIAWAPSAKRDLARPPEKFATAIIEFIYGSLAENPRRVGRELHLELAGQHAARRGEYRVIYRIDETEHRVSIVAVDHRSDVYRRP